MFMKPEEISTESDLQDVIYALHTFHKQKTLPYEQGLSFDKFDIMKQ